MFSNRLPASLEFNRLTDAIARTKDYIDLTVSNPTVVGLRYPEEIVRALWDARALAYDPDPRGLSEAREAVAGYYQKRGISAAPERILLTASTSEAYSYLFKLLCNPGEIVLTPAPSYPLFEHLAALEGVRVKNYPLRYMNGWFLDVEEVARAITKEVRAILVVNPNNPTGSFLKHEEIAGLQKLAAERDLAILSDEVFADYVAPNAPDAPRTLLGDRTALTFSLSGLSKPCGLPQLKLGWIAASGPASKVEAALSRLEHIADMFLSVGTPVQLALPRLFALGAEVRTQIARRVQTNRVRLRELAKGRATQIYASEGGWYDLLRVPATRSEDEWALALLERERVLCHPGYFFDFHDGAHLVVSLLAEPYPFSDGVGRLLSRIEAEL